MYSKKSQAGTMFALIIAIIIIVFLFVAFLWAIDNITKFRGFFGTRNIAIKMSDSSASLYSLKSYLSSPIEIEMNGKRENITVSDLIKLWNIYNDASYKNLLQSESEKIFKPFMKEEQANVYCYYLEIDNYISKTETIQLGDRHLANLDEKATVEIPISDDKTATAILIIDSLCLK